MEETADVVVIGGGVHGCAIAYNLCRLDRLRVTVLEKRYLASGATGRSAAGVRHQFGTEINCRLAIWNVRLLENLAEELDYGGDLEFTQGGYLLLAYSQAQLQVLAENVALQQSLGIPSVIVTPEQIRDIAPGLNISGVLGGSFCSRDGHVSPFHLTRAYATAACRLGARIYPFRPATSLRLEGDRTTGVRTAAGTIATETVVLAAGAEGAELARAAGLVIPVYPERHQILVSEPVAPLLQPMVLCFEDGSYFKQTPYGSFLMGIGSPYEPKGYGMEADHRFLMEMASRIRRHMPILAGIRVVRQWAGLYDITPDAQAIVGPTPVPGLWLDLGWSGHGLQFAPSIGRILAQMILGQPPLVDITPFHLDRFARGELVPEPACV